MDEPYNDNEPSSDQEESREDKNKVAEEAPTTETIRHVRRSERVRKQRYDIQPDEIGDNDDRTDQDYR